MSWGSGGQGCRRTARAEELGGLARPGVRPLPRPDVLRQALPPASCPRPAAAPAGKEELLPSRAAGLRPACGTETSSSCARPPAAARRMRRAAPPVLEARAAGAMRAAGRAWHGAGLSDGRAARPMDDLTPPAPAPAWHSVGAREHAPPRVRLGAGPAGTCSPQALRR